MAIKGINEVIAEIKKLGKQAIQDIEDETEASAKQIELDAKNNAPADLGKLGQSIIAEKIDDKLWKIEARTSIAPYAAYVEFGTGGLVEVPAEMKEIAIQFKGKGIKQVNLPARPYLYPALLRGRKIYLDNLKKILKKYSK